MDAVKYSKILYYLYMLINANLKILKIQGDNILKFFHNISASEVSLPVSYLFFLNYAGRYIADLFFITYQDNYYVISKSEILENFMFYVKTIDIRNQICFHDTDLFCYFGMDKDINEEFEDPRKIMNFCLFNQKQIAKNDEIYHDIRFQKKFAEFNEFEFEKSIVLEYGEIKKFISLQKGCYPGQELINRTVTQGIIRKTVDVVEKIDENVIRVLSKHNQKFMVLKKIC